MGSKKNLSENSIYTHFVLPALIKAGWDLQTQIRENVYFTDGRILGKFKQTSSKSHEVLHFESLSCCHQIISF